jgi:hypothetical protein
MSGQLCWMPKFRSGGRLFLHLRLDRDHPWKPHTAYPGLCVPDYPIPGGSPGWATSQKLLQVGWSVISIEQARRSIRDCSLDSLAA